MHFEAVIADPPCHSVGRFAQHARPGGSHPPGAVAGFTADGDQGRCAIGKHRVRPCDQGPIDVLGGRQHFELHRLGRLAGGKLAHEKVRAVGVAVAVEVGLVPTRLGREVAGRIVDRQIVELGTGGEAKGDVMVRYSRGEPALPESHSLGLAGASQQGLVKGANEAVVRSAGPLEELVRAGDGRNRRGLVAVARHLRSKVAEPGRVGGTPQEVRVNRADEQLFVFGRTKQGLGHVGVRRSRGQFAGPDRQLVVAGIAMEQVPIEVLHEDLVRCQPHVDREGARRRVDAAVGGATVVVYRHRDCRRALRAGDGDVRQRAGCIRAGVNDRRIGDQRRVVRGGGDGQVLGLVQAGGDARQADRLLSRAGQDRRRIGDGVDRGRGIHLRDRHLERARRRIDATVGRATIVAYRHGDRRRAERAGDGHERQCACRGGAGVSHYRIGEQGLIAGCGGDRQVLGLARPGSDTCQVDDRGRRRVFEHRGRVRDGIDRRRLVGRVDADVEGACRRIDAAVGGASVVMDRDGDGGHAGRSGDGTVGQSARRIGTGVADARVRDQGCVAAAGTDGEVLRFARPGADAGEVDRLLGRVGKDRRRVGNRVDGGGQIHVRANRHRARLAGQVRFGVRRVGSVDALVGVERQRRLAVGRQLPGGEAHHVDVGVVDGVARDGKEIVRHRVVRCHGPGLLGVVGRADQEVHVGRVVGRQVGWKGKLVSGRLAADEMALQVAFAVGRVAQLDELHLAVGAGEHLIDRPEVERQQQAVFAPLDAPQGRPAQRACRSPLAARVGSTEQNRS